MGMFRAFRDDFDYPAGLPLSPNPDPKRFVVQDHIERGGHLLVWVKYEGCTTFKGQKVLLFQDTTLKELQSWTEIDPHFVPDSRLLARFHPSHGWLAVKTLYLLCESMPS